MEQSENNDSKLNCPKKADVSNRVDEIVGLRKVDEETASEPITNALYATGKFTTKSCDQLAEGILQYLDDYGLCIAR